jgi:hypothetical protein
MEMKMKSEEWTTQKTNFVKSSSVISNSKTNHTSEVCSDISANGNEIEVRKVDYPKRQILCEV